MPDPLTKSPFVEPDDDEMLDTPRNSSTKRIFVAATRQNDGKTTTSLGLFGAMQTITKKVGFIKPVGQRFVDVQGNKIDEDTVLLDSVFDVQVPIEAMSPVAVDGSFTRRYLKNPEENLPILVDKMCRAFDRSSYQKDVCIIEGSGHAGVGAVFDLSNAQVAKLLGAKAVIVAQGGIGRPIDEIAINKALFDKYNVEVVGAILNKVLPEKVDLVREYAGAGLARLGIPLLGVVPLQKQLAAPNLSQIVEEIDGRWLNGRETGRQERILRVIIGAMSAKGVIDYLQPGVLIITPGDREDVIFSAIAAAGLSKKQLVSGIVLTRNILPHPKIMEMIAQTRIPCVICSEESYTVASRINNMTVKTQPEDHDKIPIIKRMFLEHINVKRLRDAL
ncbi:phosphotransacetylase family protein [Rubellicoccus peritrichatus]|uniref:AAA family ATPase n=1 Tax=Rubellicoccus peritrichatus TaxID=3080537 RepID=A0AAQ3QWE4_9BACT|nr:AAA family ATPase [Puniceicoccus sp. CR14]WOO41807.1 AAA family ATPase [Puniceicoccus sp. CR14]